jgi:hypothetical protein
MADIAVMQHLMGRPVRQQQPTASVSSNAIVTNAQHAAHGHGNQVQNKGGRKYLPPIGFVYPADKVLCRLCSHDAIRRGLMSAHGPPVPEVLHARDPTSTHRPGQRPRYLDGECPLTPEQRILNRFLP